MAEKDHGGVIKQENSENGLKFEAPAPMIGEAMGVAGGWASTLAAAAGSSSPGGVPSSSWVEKVQNSKPSPTRAID